MSLIKRRDRRSHPPRDNWDRKRIRKTIKAMERFSEALTRVAEAFGKWPGMAESNDSDT